MGKTLGWNDPGLAAFPRPKNLRGRSSPVRCFARAQIEYRSMCKAFLFEHLRKGAGEPKGERDGEPRLSWVVHPLADLHQH